MQRLQIGSLACRPTSVERKGGIVGQLRFPLRDLIRMNLETLRKLRDSLLTLDRCKSHFRLKGCGVVPPDASCHFCSSIKGFSPSGEQTHHLNRRPIIRGHLYRGAGIAR